MRINRRVFLKLFLTVPLLSGTRRLFAKVVEPAALSGQEVRTLRAYLDTLIPADENSPSALELGVDKKVVAEANRNSRYRRIIKKGCHWLDTQARGFKARDFSVLKETARERIIGLAAHAKPRSLPHVFFQKTRWNAFYYYYGDRRSWSIPGYPHPPQPLGFMDYTQPPQRRG